MFKELKRKIQLKKLNAMWRCEQQKVCFWKSELYDIEHDSCVYSEDFLIKVYGSAEAYKQRMLYQLNEIIKRRDEIMKQIYDLTQMGDS